MNRATYQIGGSLLVLAAVIGVTAGFLHGPQPQSLEALAALGAGWTVSHVFIAVAGTLFAVTSLFFVRHFAGSAGEGWALLGAGSLLLGGVGLLTVGAVETAGFTGLLGAEAGGEAVAAEHAFLATTAVMGAMATATSFLMAGAIAALGAGMLGDAAWPGWLAWLGIGIGLAVLALNTFGIAVPGAPGIPMYLLNGWIAVAGVIFFRAGRTALPDEVPVQQRPETSPRSGGTPVR